MRSVFCNLVAEITLSSGDWVSSEDTDGSLEGFDGTLLRNRSDEFSAFLTTDCPDLAFLLVFLIQFANKIFGCRVETLGEISTTGGQTT